MSLKSIPNFWSYFPADRAEVIINLCTIVKHYVHIINIMSTRRQQIDVTDEQ